MKYYLVALLNKDDYIRLEKIQRSISRKYKIYKRLPMLHITLEVLEDPDMDKLEKVIKKILSPYKKFKVEINGAICFEPPYKSVNLNVTNQGYIRRIIRNINDTLKLYGFRVRRNIDKWDLHMSLANTNYATRNWSNKEYVTACSNLKKDRVYDMVKIDKIELWKPVNNKREMVVKSFPLREY